MENHSEKAKELFKQGYNCSQAVLGAFVEELGMDFETAIKISSSFGGGIGRMREVCGAASGMFMAAGLQYWENNKSEHYARIQELAKRFKEANGSIICRELLDGIESSNAPTPSPRTETYYKKRPCVELVGCAAEIFEQYLEENIQIK